MLRKRKEKEVREMNEDGGSIFVKKKNEKRKLLRSDTWRNFPRRTKEVVKEEETHAEGRSQDETNLSSFSE